MSRAVSYLCTALACTTLTLACGDDGGQVPGADAASSADAMSQADATPPAPTIQDICNATDGAYVKLFEKMFACVPEFELILGSLPDSNTLNTLCDEALGKFIADGTATLGSAADLAACRAHIDGLTCDQAEFDAPNGCQDVIIGTRAIDASCDDDIQCIGDAYCDTSGAGTCGVCKARKADGMNCFEGEECTNRRCSGVDGSTAGMCRAFGDTGDDCSETEDCLGTQVCNATTKKCQIKQNWVLGDDCTSNDANDCNFPFGDLYCDEGTTNKCVAYAPVGADCGFCKFTEYSVCDTGNTDKCLAPTIQPLNANCGMLDGQKCAAGLICSNPFRDPNDAQSPQGTCVEQPEPGDACSTKDDCGNFILECVANKCQYGSHTAMCPAST